MEYWGQCSAESSRAVDQYPLVSSLVGLLLLFAFVPLMGILGAISGAVGTLVRRPALPDEYNPPAPTRFCRIVTAL